MNYLAVLNDLMEVDIIDEVIYFKGKVVPSEVRNTVRSVKNWVWYQPELY